MPRSSKLRQRKRWNTLKDCRKRVELQLFGSASVADVTSETDEEKFSKFLDPTNFETLTKNYETIVNLLLDKMSLLLNETNFLKIRTLELEFVLMMNVLQNLVQVKNSLIVMSGLSPPLFDLLFEKLHLTDVKLIDFSPMVHLSVLITAKKFAAVHEYFFLNSELILRRPNSDYSFVSESKSSKWFEQMVRLIIQMIKEGHRFQKDVLLEFLNFVQGIADIASDCDAEIIQKLKKELIFFTFIAIDKPYAIRRVFENLARKFALSDAFPTDSTQKSKNFWRKFFKQYEGLSGMSLKNLYYVFPSASFFKILLNYYYFGLFIKHQPLMLEHNLQQKEFGVLMSFLLRTDGKVLSYKEDNAEKMFDVYLTQEKAAMSGSGRWRYLINRLALYCVDNKMRTPFGKPLETFTAFDNSINSILSNTTIGNQLQYNLFSTMADFEGEEDEQQKLMTPAEEFLRVNCLLTFVDVLEKLMIYTERGSILDVARPSDAAKQFFFTNAASCQAWVARVTLSVQKVAFRAGRYAQVIRFANAYCINVKQRVQKLKPPGNFYKLDDNAIMILGYLTQALVELNAAAAVAGVRTFAKEVFNADLEFTWPAEYLAAGKLELALENINKLLLVQGLSQFIQELLSNLRFNVIRKLRNPVMLGQLSSNESPSGIASDNFKRLQTLINWDKPDELLLNENISLPWEVEKRLEDFEIKFMDIYSKMNINCKNIRNKWDSVAKKPFEDQLKLVSFELSRYSYVLNAVDVTPKIRTKFAVLDAIKRCVSMKLSDFGFKNGIAKKEVDFWLDYEQIIADDWKLDTTDRLAFAIQLNNWIVQMAAPTSEVLSKSQELLVKLSRKTDNSNTARYYFRRLEKLVNDRMMKQQHSYTNGMMSPSGNQFIYSHQHQSVAPYGIPVMGHNNMMGFIPVVSPLQINTNNMNGMPSPPSLDLAIHAAKISRLFRQQSDDDSAFFALANIAASQDILCSPSISPAPGLVRNDGEFARKILKIKKVCLKLGNWSKDVSNAHQKICDANRFTPTLLWDMVIKRFNLLSGYCGNVDGEKTLAGAFYWLSTEIGNNLTGCDVSFAKAHRKMSEWALDQLYEADETLIKLTALETKKLENWGIKAENSSFKRVRKALTTAVNFEDFQIQVSEALGSENLSVADLNEPLFATFFDQVKQRQKGLYDVALCGCMQFLTNLGRSESTIHSVAATLHILQLLVSRPDLFESSIRGGLLSQINERVWKDIIPQLFARLNHPNVIVRNVICDLLKMIAQSSPHAVCFPAIVGAYFSRPILVAATEDEAQNDENDENSGLGMPTGSKHDRSLMSAACLNLVQSIKGNYPKLIDDVTMFVKELQRINMLYEEKWAFVLNNLEMEMLKRLRQIRTDNNLTTIVPENSIKSDKGTKNRKRFDVFFGSIRKILQDLFDLTCTSTDDMSVNEEQFQRNFKEEISKAFDHFDEYRVSDPKFAWEAFRKLGTTFNQRASRKFSISLSTSDMSPYLSAMENTAIPIPDQELNEGRIVTIAKMKENVSVLLTKTRPKKITFVGSDGRDYVFLFKGQEDLHLDERVMQLLHICNLMLSDKKTIEPNDAWPPYYSQNYSVTPIGIRSGLIRWVEGATPMFQIYKKWKSRQAAAERKNNPADASAQPSDVERPMDLFAKQLQNVFNENNVANDIRCDRKRWPVSLLRLVMERLIEATPRDILSKELWMAAGNSETWWRVTQRFARSAAVASMVGSIIGLGDRHMENLLINLSTGDIIHIDYNVCFDKGRHLRVPETVPFRLSGNIIYALGPTQIEGTFRKSCEHVISVLRNGKETLLAMLDAFVYDPLVDWAMQDQMHISVNVGTMLAVYGHKISLQGGDEGGAKTKVKAAQEEENMHAKLISKRIRRRLEGREHLENLSETSTLQDVSKLLRKNTIDAPLCAEGPEMTPAEQVEMLISCATNVNNLAFMYEGWTAWV